MITLQQTEILDGLRNSGNRFERGTVTPLAAHAASISGVKRTDWDRGRIVASDLFNVEVLAYQPSQSP